jgi:hypothetical protein
MLEASDSGIKGISGIEMAGALGSGTENASDVSGLSLRFFVDRRYSPLIWTSSGVSSYLRFVGKRLGVFRGTKFLELNLSGCLPWGKRERKHSLIDD